MFLRLLTSATIRSESVAYAPFLFHPETGSEISPQEFCERFVEACGKEAGAPHHSCCAHRPLEIDSGMEHRSCPDRSFNEGPEAQHSSRIPRWAQRRGQLRGLQKRPSRTERERPGPPIQVCLVRFISALSQNLRCSSDPGITISWTEKRKCRT